MNVGFNEKVQMVWIALVIKMAIKLDLVRGLHSTDVAYLLLTQDPGAPSLNPSIPPKNFRGKITDIAEVN